MGKEAPYLSGHQTGDVGQNLTTISGKERGTLNTRDCGGMGGRYERERLKGGQAPEPLTGTRLSNLPPNTRVYII